MELATQAMTAKPRDAYYWRLFATADYVADLPPDAAGFERYRKRATRRPS